MRSAKLCKVQNFAKCKIMQCAKLSKVQNYARCQIWWKFKIIQVAKLCTVKNIQSARLCKVWKCASIKVRKCASASSSQHQSLAISDSQHQSAFVQQAHPPAFCEWWMVNGHLLNCLPLWDFTCCRLFPAWLEPCVEFVKMKRIGRGGSLLMGGNGLREACHH